VNDQGEITELLRQAVRHLAAIAAAVERQAPAELEQPAPADPVEQLRRWCRENGHVVLPDASVYEDTAARILDRSPGTLKNWRGRGGDQLPFYRHGRSGRIRYRLTDLADAIEEQRFGE
jgi:hypothetical protein